MRVSIALATYNGSPWIQQQLDSYLNQSRLPDELVVFDDGSDDETVEILRRFRIQAPFDVHVNVPTRRVGYARNFERAIRDCSGDVIFLSDQDDVWYPQKIASVLNSFSSSGKALVIHDQDVVEWNLDPDETSMLERVRNYYRGSDGNHVKGCATAVRAEFAQDVFPIPDESRQSHDDWLHAVATALGQRHVLGARLMAYRIHGNNASGFFLNTPHPPVVPATTERFLRRVNGFRSVDSESLEALLREREWVLERSRDLAPCWRSEPSGMGALEPEVRWLGYRVRAMKRSRTAGQLVHVAGRLLRGL